MKKYLFVFLLFNSYLSFSQKIKAIGLDVGSNIFPAVLGFKGFSGSILIQVDDSSNKSKIMEYIIGYASYNLNSNGLLQKNEGFFVAIGKSKKNFGLHGIFAVSGLQNTLYSIDPDFNVPYSYQFETEGIIAVGADIFYELPIKLSDKVKINPRIELSVSIGNKPQTSKKVYYLPGFNLQADRFFVPTFGFGLSIPVLLNLK